MAITTLGVAVTALALSAAQSIQARRETKRARRLQEKRGRLEASRSAVEQVRAAQIARSQIIQSGTNQGVGDSSSVAGGVASVQSQAASNIGFANQLFQLSTQAGSRLASAATLRSASQGLGQIAAFAASHAGPDTPPAPVTDISIPAGT